MSDKRTLLFLSECDEGTKVVTLMRVSVLVQLYPKSLWSWNMTLIREIGVEGRKVFQEEERATLWEQMGHFREMHTAQGWLEHRLPSGRRRRKGYNRQVDCVKANNKELRELHTPSLKQDYLILALTQSWSEGLCLKKNQDINSAHLCHHLITLPEGFSEVSLGCAGESRVLPFSVYWGRGRMRPLHLPTLRWADPRRVWRLEPLKMRQRFLWKTAFLSLAGLQSLAWMGHVLAIPGNLSPQQCFVLTLLGGSLVG